MLHYKSYTKVSRVSLAEAELATFNLQIVTSLEVEQFKTKKKISLRAGIAIIAALLHNDDYIIKFKYN